MDGHGEHGHGDRGRGAPRRGFFGALRTNFLTGLVIVAPVFLTFYFIWWLVGFIDSWVLPWVPDRYNPSTYIGINIRGVGLAIFLIFTVMIGWVMKGLVGRTLIRIGEDLVARMPVVRTIYNGVKQIIETVLSQSEASFERACLIEYPRKGIWAIAFVATRTRGEVLEKAPGEDDMLSLFLPTTPNPTSGFLLFVPRRDVILLDMTVEDAAKLIISAGLVTPPPREAAPPALSEN